jgi:glyoxylase-like metal-dependent hydrolase (beta-lactamase superfamily II)
MNDLAITTMKIGMLRFDLPAIYGLADDHPFAGQVVDSPMLCYHIAWPGRALLVDAMAYDIKEIPEEFQVDGYVPPPSLPEQMAQRRLDLRAVRDVVITHAHFDHYGALSKEVNGNYVPSFPQARHYLSAADWDPEEFSEFDQRTLGLMYERDLLALVDGELDLGNGLAILPAPGETDGHQILSLRYGKQVYYFVGDLYHHVLEFADTEANVNWADENAMAESKTMFMKMAVQSGALVFFSHIEGAYTVLDYGEGGLSWERVE